ncbi:hypothetical protein [Desulfuromonas soudanensis]|nr:hypothetical protein [Desulfuromonas soudanensis]
MTMRLRLLTRGKRGYGDRFGLLKNAPVPLSFRCGRGEPPGNFPVINA